MREADCTLRFSFSHEIMATAAAAAAAVLGGSRNLIHDTVGFFDGHHHYPNVASVPNYYSRTISEVL